MFTSSAAAARPQPLATRPRRLWAAVAAAVALTAVAGCSGPTPAGAAADPDVAVVAPAGQSVGTPRPVDGTPQNLLVIFSVHANAPAPQLTDRLRELVGHAVATEGIVTLVTLDGCPRRVFKGQFAKPNQAANAAKAKAAAVEKVGAYFARTEAVCHGSDLASALALARDSLSENATGYARILVLDSFLPDSGPINLTIPGVFLTDPDSYVAALRRFRALPDLAGFDVELSGVGYTTAPQAPLGPGYRSILKDLFLAVFAATGANSVVISDAVLEGLPPATAFTVNPTVLPSEADFPEGGPTGSAGADGSGGTFVVIAEPVVLTYPDDSRLQFRPDTAELAYPDQARAHLAPLAQWLADRPGRQIEVAGTCATGCDQADPAANLSYLRAEAIRQTLADLGGDLDRMTAVGLGVVNDPPIPLDAAGRPDLASPEASQNRSVRFTLTDG
jgi:hypothetical protein